VDCLGVEAVDKIPEEKLHAWSHSSEGRWAVVAAIATIPIAALMLLVSIVSLGLLPLIVIVGTWFGGRMAEARLRGNAVIISDHNFPDVASQINLMCQRMGYPKEVRAYVVQDGDINALLWRVFGRKYLAFNSGLMESMSTLEREFIVARFVGALRARHLRFHEVASFVDGMEKLWILNLPVLPYFRTTVYSGDRFGLMVCGDFNVCASALKKMLMGRDLGPKLSLVGLLEQGLELRTSRFRRLAVLFSTHPHMTDRFLDLAAFAKQQGLLVSDEDELGVEPRDLHSPPSPLGPPSPDPTAQQGKAKGAEDELALRPTGFDGSQDNDARFGSVPSFVPESGEAASDAFAAGRGQPKSRLWNRLLLFGLVVLILASAITASVILARNRGNEADQAAELEAERNLVDEEPVPGNGGEEAEDERFSGFRSEAEENLWFSVPPEDCQSGHRDVRKFAESPNEVYAGIICLDPHPSINYVTYWEYFDYQGMTEEYGATLSFYRLPENRNDCEFDSTAEHAWESAGSEGRLACWVDDGTAYLMWTYEGSWILAYASSETGDEVALYEWWSNGNWDLGG
jgi:Zn-dependent protease with chaperone function